MSNIQSLSICVPCGCPNNCAYCGTRMRGKDANPYPNMIEGNEAYHGLYEKMYQKRLAYARDNGCNVMMFTGAGEPMANLSFLIRVGRMNRGLASPFRRVELQTSGIKLLEDDSMLAGLRGLVGVDTISLSLADVFDSENNARIQGISPENYFDIRELCETICRSDINLRLSLNMSDVYNGVPPEKIFETARLLGANQITFRKLYIDSAYADSVQAKWIVDHPYVRKTPRFFTDREREIINGPRVTRAFVDITEEWIHDGMRDIDHYIARNGTPLEVLPFGETRYSVHGMSTVADLDCMSKEVKPDGSIKYLILREDCHLYTRWDDPGSRLF